MFDTPTSAVCKGILTKLKIALILWQVLKLYNRLMSNYEKDAQAWDTHYITIPVQQLPWNAGGPDTDLVRLVQDGTIPVGQALDIGSGPGHDSVYLIQRGFNVIGIDISPTAVVITRENVSHAGLFGFFQTGDIRKIPVEDHFIDFAFDRGCFHTLSPEDRPAAISEVARVLRKRGLYLLRVFSDKEPPATQQAGERPMSGARHPGPHRFSRAEIEALFTPLFHIRQFTDGSFAGPRQPKSYTVLMEKK